QRVERVLQGRYILLLRERRLWTWARIGYVHIDAAFIVGTRSAAERNLHSPPLGVQRRVGGVANDLQQPRPSRPAAKRCEVFPSTFIGVLHDVLGNRWVANQPTCQVVRG